MNRDSSFTRKVIYATCIALLLYPLYYLGQPATRDSEGGRLAQFRAKQGLAQSQLGDIDPASETMRLATLGLRGVAVTLLWEKANEFKMKKDWENLSATVQQIIKLQPNFISVWEFQGHNLAYNVSVEFDDYRHRYEWVRRGTEFLVQGQQFNRDEPGLLWYVGWVVGQKFGRADEHKQFRKMFAADEDFHRLFKEEGDIPVDSPDARGPDGRPDNWLVSRLWFDKGIAAIRKGKSLRRKSPLVYYSTTYMQRINHATMIEEEGTLDEKAQFAWQRAFEDWMRFGDVQVPSTWGHNVRLNDLARLEAERDEIAATLDELVPGVRASILESRRAALSPEETEALTVAELKRTPEQHLASYAAQQKLIVSHLEVAAKASEQNHDRAQAIAKRLVELEEVYIIHTRRYRDQVNYPYWLERCTIEQTRDAIDARRHLYLAEEFNEKSDVDSALKEYELAWEKWADLIDKFPSLMSEETVTNLDAPMRKYMLLLNTLDQELPEDFRLREIWQRQQQMQRQRAAPPPAADPSALDTPNREPNPDASAKP